MTCHAFKNRLKRIKYHPILSSYQKKRETPPHPSPLRVQPCSLQLLIRSYRDLIVSPTQPQLSKSYLFLSLLFQIILSSTNHYSYTLVCFQLSSLGSAIFSMNSSDASLFESLCVPRCVTLPLWFQMIYMALLSIYVIIGF